MQLNQEQTLAAQHPQGEAALLLAGAGSGKTRVLSERISWLIEQGVPPRKILALTFTNKAASEIRQRVLERTGLTEDQAPRLTTIHSLALSFVRKNPVGFGLDQKVSPLADYDQIDLLKKVIHQMGEVAPSDANPWAIQEKIEYHRARGVGFAVDYTDEVHDAALHTHKGYHALIPQEVEVWRRFEEFKREANALDFSDMLWFVNRRIKQDPEWAVKVQALFNHVLLDEAQDTSKCAWEFVNNLMGESNCNLFITGDLSQSIYAFAGATPQLIFDFAESWRGTKPTVYRLVRNHRSVPEIVNLANAIEEKIASPLSLKMVSHRGEQGDKGACRIFRRRDPRDLAQRIAQEIQRIGGSFSDHAILVRTANQVRELEGELIRARIPYVVRGGRGLLQTEEARDMLAYLRLATNPRDFSALSRASTAPKRGIGYAALELIRRKARQDHQGDLVKAGLALGGKMAGLAESVQALQQYMLQPALALEKCVLRTDYRGYLVRKYSKEPHKVETKMENLGRLQEMIKGLSDSEMSIEDMIFQLTMDRSEAADERGVVVISTIHSSKGLEYRHCYIFQISEGILPHHFSRGSEAELAEERRALYVAVTRAQDTCYLTVSELVQMGKNLVEVDQSRFLTELGIQ